MLPAEILKRYRIRKGADFRLADIDPADTLASTSIRPTPRRCSTKAWKRLSALQERPDADHTYR